MFHVKHDAVLIRPGTADDAPGVAAVHVQAWREAYVGIIPQAVLDRRDQTVSVERWAGILGDAQGGSWVAVDAEQGIVGWATSGPSRDDDAPTGLELYGLYVLKACYDRGVGWRLLEAAIGTTEPASLWVLKANERARAFYARQGFSADGAEKDVDFQDLGEPVPEIRMIREGRRRRPPRA